MNEPILDPVLLSAHEMGLLFPCWLDIKCLRPEVNSANSVLWVMWKWDDDWQTTEQIAHLAGKHPNICYSYLDRLFDLGLVLRRGDLDWRSQEWILNPKVSFQSQIDRYSKENGDSGDSCSKPYPVSN